MKTRILRELKEYCTQDDVQDIIVTIGDIAGRKFQNIREAVSYALKDETALSYVGQYVDID